LQSIYSAIALGISREHLYKFFSETGNPTLKSLTAVMRALGVKLSAKPIKQSKATKPRGSTIPAEAGVSPAS
jgi:hypothetical protein